MSNAVTPKQIYLQPNVEKDSHYLTFGNPFQTKNKLTIGSPFKKK